MWLCAHNKLLTNLQRKKRNFTSNSLCGLCRNAEEIVIHALRDCPATKDMWKMLVNPSHWSKFFKGDIIEWFYFNSRREIGKMGNLNWKLTFGEAIRRIWLKRNAWIFRNEACDTTNLFWSIITTAKEYDRSSNALKFTDLVGQEIHIAWQPPEEGWVKCNVDGPNSEYGSAAGCGGIIRDASGVWITGFRMKLGRMDTLSAEIWSILLGLQIAWEKGFRRVILESGSTQVIRLTGDTWMMEHPLVSLIQKINELLNRIWEVSLQHCFQEGNEAANWLAKKSRKTDGQLEVID